MKWMSLEGARDFEAQLPDSRSRTATRGTRILFREASVLAPFLLLPPAALCQHPRDRPPARCPSSFDRQRFWGNRKPERNMACKQAAQTDLNRKVDSFQSQSVAQNLLSASICEVRAAYVLLTCQQLLRGPDSQRPSLQRRCFGEGGRGALEGGLRPAVPGARGASVMRQPHSIPAPLSLELGGRFSPSAADFRALACLSPPDPVPAAHSARRLLRAHAIREADNAPDAGLGPFGAPLHPR